jgi:hypothetical protein
MSRTITALSLWCCLCTSSMSMSMLATVVTLSYLQPASSFPLERTIRTAAGVAGSSLRWELQARVQLQAHGPECSNEKDAIDQLQPQQQQPQQQPQQQQRRQVLQTLGGLSVSTLSLVPFGGLATVAQSARAAAGAVDVADDDDTQTQFVRRTDQYSYQFTPPPHFTAPGNKPLKTHLDEHNFQSSTTAGFQFGITVDPVRLQSLSEFGTPGEVAAKVVTAEVNRDGVFDVKLMSDPIMEQKAAQGDNNNSGSSSAGAGAGEGTSSGLVLDYLSSGKRGDKRFIAKLFVQQGKLYVLTAQCRQADYDTVKTELLEAVDSFRVLAAN